MESSFDIDIAGGGYHASTESENGHISVFRLLDFNQNVYHVALFKEKFVATPTLEELTALSPLIGHVPIDALGLLRNKDLPLLGCKPLSREDLEGYAYYLKAHEVPADEIGELLERILSFTTESPLKLRLEIINEELVISERS